MIFQTRSRYDIKSIKVRNFYITGIGWEAQQFYDGDYEIFFID